MRVQVTVPRLHIHPAPLRAVGTNVLVTLGKMSVTVTVVPSVGPALAALLTVIVKTPGSLRVKLPVCVLVMERAACATDRLADAVLPVPPLVELTAPLTLL